MQYQYLGTYENYQLQCPKCSEVFLARGIHSTAPSNGAGGFGWHFDPHRQDFGVNKQPASAAFNGAGNAFINGGRGGFNPFLDDASIVAFFSFAAAAAAAQSKMAAAAAAASSALPPNNLAADFVQKSFDKLNRERVEAEREVGREEKELSKKEKEKDLQRKARDAESSWEARERLMAKQKEQEMAMDAGKIKMYARAAGRKFNRKKRDNEHEDDEENLEDNDPKVYGQRMSMQDDQHSLGRRSSGAKNNVTAYKVDFGDDSDLDDFPVAKRGKFEGGAEDGLEDEDEQVCQKQSDYSMKAKSVPKYSHFMKRDVGAKSGEELDGSRHVKEKNRGDQGKAANKDPHNLNFVGIPIRSDPTARESKLYGGPGVTHRGNGGKSSQQAESPSARLKTDRVSHRDLRNENSPSKSRSTVRTRIRSSQLPFGSKSLFFGEDHMMQQPLPSPTKSLASIPSEPNAEEDSEGFEEDSDVQGIVVPSPEFHDFDYSRTEMDVRPGQIWAIYDDQDGMPRFFGRISQVSTKPFRAYLNWLEKSASTDIEIAWMKSTGLSLACGEFEIGKTTFMDQINTFSHIVMEKSGKGMLINIYPEKGQVWAIYRNWGTEQRIGSVRVVRSNGRSPYTYDMVEILSDFSDGYSLKAAVLFKISGFKTVFSRHKDMEEFRYFKPTELVQFSHNVLNQRIDDVEAERRGIPRGALELDPAATPLDLIMSPSDLSE